MCRPRFALAGLVAAAGLLAAAGASASDPAHLRAEASDLRAADARIEAQRRSAVLELYALDSRLARAEERLATLRRETAVLERERAAARKRLRLLRASLAEAERRLEERLQELYVSGDPDPLAVLLGAQSLPDALAALDSVDRFARADREIVAEVSAARGDVRRALADLAARRAALDAATSEARAARDSLAAARDERSSYLASLTRRRELNQRRIAALTERAATIESQATEVAATQLSAPAAAPSAGPVPAGGTQMTVVATGYSIDGTTSTGMPAGWGVAAVDPSVIPLGTRMTVPGYGEAVAADTGSAIGGAAIDLWFPTPAQALAWGRRTVTITLH